MDYHVGIGGKDFAMLCCDTTAVQQIINIKNDEEKLVPVDSHKLFAMAGGAGDRVHFTDFIIANGNYYTQLLLAGYDKGKGASLFWFDHIGTMHKMNLCGTGYGASFALAIFDKMWHPKLTQDEAFEMMKLGVAEVRKRLVVAPERFRVQVVTQEGIKDLGYI